MNTATGSSSSPCPRGLRIATSPEDVGPACSDTMHGYEFRGVGAHPGPSVRPSEEVFCFFFINIFGSFGSMGSLESWRPATFL